MALQEHGMKLNQTISNFKIIEKLGAGAMGIVYKARDLKLERPVAIKFLPHEVAGQPAERKRFKIEAKAAAALNHPNIATIYQIEEVADQVFIVMEYVDGHELKSLLVNRDGHLLPVAEALNYAAQIAGGLQAAHKSGVVHRDIKPANIMLTRKGQIKIMDFGLAKLRDQSVTQTGSTLGTAADMSPEQAQALSVDQRSDIFSYGVVLYEVLAGQRPFKGDYVQAVMYSIVNDDPEPIAKLRPEVPEHLQQLVTRALEKNPEVRYQSMAELLTDLAAFTGETRTLPAVLRPERHVVGRDKELAELQTGLQGVFGGKGVLLCLAGEAGIGKTTLVEEFLDEIAVASRPCFVSVGQCSERLSGTGAYLPFLEALEGLLRSETDTPIARLMREKAPWWYVQVASLSPDDPASAALLADVRNATQERAKRELATFLQEAARHRPLLFVFEDLHGADVSTIDMLAYLAPKFDTMRLLIVATYRPADLMLAKHPFLQIKPDLTSRGHCREIPLRFLRNKDIERYLEMEYPDHAFPGAFSKLIHNQTEGSPLFMADLVRDLENRAVIVEDQDQWQLSQSVADIQPGLPESALAMVQQKIDQLCEDDHRLLQAASVQGFEFDSAVLAKSQSLQEEQVEERLQALERDYRFVRFMEEEEFPDNTLTLRYRFVHALYQNELVKSMTRTRKARLAKAIAETLMACYGEKSGKVASELALLFEAARDFQRAVEYFAMAAQNTLQVFAYQETIKLARRGIELLMTLEGTPECHEREVGLRISLGLALMASLGPAAPEVAQNNNRQQELIQELRESPLRFPALWAVMGWHFIGGDLPNSLHDAQQLLDIAQGQNDPTLLLLAYHAMTLAQLYRGSLEAARSHVENALELYEPQQHEPLAYLYGSGDIKVNAICHYGWDLWLMGYPERAVKAVQEGLALSKKLDQPYSIAHAVLFAACLHQFRQEAQEVREYATEGISVCTEHGYPHWLGAVMFQHGWALTRMQQMDGC